MNKTKIEWCDYTINPVKGLCPMACPYCYARRMYKRFKWDETIRLDLDSFLPFLETTKIKPSRIFVGSTMELFGDWVKSEWIEFIFKRVRLLPEHTFIFLTKQPQNLIKWSPFPDNCWVGVSVVDWLHFADLNINQIQAKVKFVSFEPLQEYIPMDGLNLVNKQIDWVIIGAQTPYSPKNSPEIGWVEEITDAAKEANIPVFHKNNLGWIFDADGFPMRQEFPK